MTAAVGCAYLFDTNSSNDAPTVTTIDAIESRIGFYFFVNVPATLQSSAESSTHTFFSFNKTEPGSNKFVEIKKVRIFVA